MRLLAFFAALFFASGAFAADVAVPSYAVVADKSFVKFIATMNGAPVEGQFKDFTANIAFDPEHPEKSNIKVEVSIASVAAANSDVEGNVKTADWLSADKFPKATFVSTKINRMPLTNNYYADGELTIRGQKKPVTLNFLMEYPAEGRAIATGYVTLQRKDFGVGQGQWQDEASIKNLVRVEFRIVADKK